MNLRVNPHILKHREYTQELWNSYRNDEEYYHQHRCILSDFGDRNNVFN